MHKMLGFTRTLKYTKLFFAFFAGMLVLAACSKDDAQPDIQIAFDKTSYDIPVSGEVTITITSNRAVPQNITIPVVLSGTAVKGSDYTLSAEAATLVAGTDKATIVLTAAPNFDRTKTITIDLGMVPPGTQKGSVSSASVGIPDASLIIYSFASQTFTMTETAEVGFELKTVAGAYVADKELRIPIAVGAGSTAVEGTHFSFDGAKEVVVAAGQSRGVVKLKYIKQEAGKDAIELKLGAASSHYVAGNYEKTKVVIFGPVYNQLVGSWTFKALTNEDWWYLNMNYLGDDLGLLPKNNTNKDTLTFSTDGLQAKLQGVLKNYFRTSAITYIGEVNERLQEGAGFPPPLVKILLVKANANVAFSATTKVERQAEIGFRVFQNAGKDILEVTIRDYEPVDFLQNTYAFYKTLIDVPSMKSVPLRYHFEKVNP